MSVFRWCLILLTTIWIVHACSSVNRWPGQASGYARIKPRSATADTVSPHYALRLMADEDSIRLKAFNSGICDLLFVQKRAEDDVVIQQWVVPPKDSLVLYSYQQMSRDTLQQRLSDAYNFAVMLGNPDSIHPVTNYLYRLPFRKGRRFKLSQGFNGSFSHNNDRSRYALDFVLPVGEPIMAARAGRVVEVVEHFSKSGGPEYILKGNKVVIEHEDGTFGSYVHLDYNGAVVEVGEYVERGEHIAYSGNTGFTRGAHLHFVVRKGNNIAVKIFFEGYEDVLLKKNKKYYIK